MTQFANETFNSVVISKQRAPLLFSAGLYFEYFQKRMLKI